MPLVDIVVSPVRTDKHTLVGAGVIHHSRAKLPETEQPPMLLVHTQCNLTEHSLKARELIFSFMRQFKLPISETALWSRKCMISVYSGAGTIQTYTELTKDKPTVTTGIQKARAEFSALTDEIIAMAPAKKEPAHV